MPAAVAAQKALPPFSFSHPTHCCKVQLEFFSTEPLRAGFRSRWIAKPRAQKMDTQHCAFYDLAVKKLRASRGKRRSLGTACA
jgi:hypothetical protein